MLIFNYDLKLEKYPLVSKKIEFEANYCSDGICCFTRTDRDDPELAVKKKSKSEMFLITAPIISYNLIQEYCKRSGKSFNRYLSSMTLEKVLSGCGFRHYQRNFWEGWKIQPGERCEDLAFTYKIIDDRLLLKFECSNYESRPNICREYPKQPICTYARYCRKLEDQIKTYASSALFIYALNKDIYPELMDFSIGEIKTGFLKKREYLLIPCPHFDSLDGKLSSIIPSDYYGKD